MRTSRWILIVVLARCSGSPERSKADPCSAVGDQIVRLALRDGRSAMTPMLGNIGRGAARECRADKWSEATRQCLLTARTAAEAMRRCPITWGPGKKRPARAKPPAPLPCTNASWDGRYIKCLRALKCGNRPKSVEFSPDGKQLWVALHYDRPAVEIFDTTTWTLLGAVDLGRYGAVELAFSPDGKRAYASQYETASVFEIDRASLRVGRQLRTDSKASKVIALSPDGSRIYVANWSGHNVSEFDARSGKRLRNLPVDGIPRGLFVTDDQRSLYVASFSPGRLYKIDLATGATKTVYAGGRAIRHIVGDRSSNTLYVSDLGNSHLYKVNMATDDVRVLATANPKTNTIDLSPDGRVLFASNRGRNNPVSFLYPGPEWGSIEAFDTITGQRLDTVIAGNQTTGLSVSPDGHLLAVSDFLDNRINVYRLADSKTMLHGGGPSHSAELEKRHFSPDEPRAPHDPDYWDRLPAPVPPFIPAAAGTSH